jgi:hypothetical protein
MQVEILFHHNEFIFSKIYFGTKKNTEIKIQGSAFQNIPYIGLSEHIGIVLMV